MRKMRNPPLCVSRCATNSSVLVLSTMTFFFFSFFRQTIEEVVHRTPNAKCTNDKFCEAYLKGYHMIDVVSIHLQLRDEEQPRDLCYLLRLVNQTNPAQSIQYGGPLHNLDIYRATHGGSGWPCFVEKEKFYDTEAGFYHFGKVIVEAEVYHRTLRWRSTTRRHGSRHY